MKLPLLEGIGLALLRGLLVHPILGLFGPAFDFRRFDAAGPARSEAFGARTIEYGTDSTVTIVWDDAAADRMKKIPAFVREMASPRHEA